MRIRVQKFGGTSVDTSEHRNRAADWVEQAVREDWRPVVVVSAMGRRGAPYATDTLLDLTGSGGTPRERDLLASCGEIIAAVVMSALLQERGLKAEALTGADAGIVTDDSYGHARVLAVDPSPLLALVGRGTIPVVAGFQGKSVAGHVTTLGRGASDTTAAVLGAALSAEVVEIFTDVDGIKTADPRIVPDARTLATLEYEEVFQMASTGARVVHPRAVEIARRSGVPLRIRGTLSQDPGTLVASAPPSLDPWARRVPDTAVSGVTHLDDVVQVECRAPDPPNPHWALTVFRGLAHHHVSVDLINVFPERAYFTIGAVSEGTTVQVLKALKIPFRLDNRRAIVSIVGSAIHGLPGVMARVMEAFDTAGAAVLQTADSHSTISCLVPRADMEAAVRALHAQFHLAGPPDDSDELPTPQLETAASVPEPTAVQDEAEATEAFRRLLEGGKSIE